MRGACATYGDNWITECSEKAMINALRKEGGCLPGKRWCVGWQTMFDGPKRGIECRPWDLDCALRDYFGDDEDISDERKKYPMLARMRKTTLTIEEAQLIDDYTDLLNDNIWYTGLRQTQLTDE